MSDEHQEAGVAPATDSGLARLAMLARFHNLATSPGQPAHEFASQSEAFAQSKISLVAKRLGLKTTAIRSKLERLSRAALSALDRGRNDGLTIPRHIDAGKSVAEFSCNGHRCSTDLPFRSFLALFSYRTSGAHVKDRRLNEMH